MEAIVVNSIDVRALRMLRERVVDALDGLHTDLGSGSQVIRDDAAATGMNCMRYIGSIQALKGMLKEIQSVDDEINGREPSKD